MTDEEFDRDVESLQRRIYEQVEGEQFSVVVYALAEVIFGGVDDPEDLKFVGEVMNDLASGLSFETVTIQ